MSIIFLQKIHLNNTGINVIKFCCSRNEEKNKELIKIFRNDIFKSMHDFDNIQPITHEAIRNDNCDNRKIRMFPWQHKL